MDENLVLLTWNGSDGSLGVFLFNEVESLNEVSMVSTSRDAFF